MAQSKSWIKTHQKWVDLSTAMLVYQSVNICKRLPEGKYPYKSPSTTINIHAYPDANTPLVRDITQRVEMPGVADVLGGLEPHLLPSGYD